MNTLSNNNVSKSIQPSTNQVNTLKDTKTQCPCCFGSEVTLKSQPAKDEVSFAGPLTGSR